MLHVACSYDDDIPDEQEVEDEGQLDIAGESGTASQDLLVALKLGRSIRWDGAKEEVIGDADANRLLSRAYRSPWVYPR